MDSVDWLFLYRWNSLLLKPHERVNTILTHFLRLRRHATTGRRESDCTARLRQRARAVVRSRSGSIPHHLSPIATMSWLRPSAFTVSAPVWDEASELAQISA